MALNGSKWLQMAPNYSRWFQMAPNVSNWLQMALSGSKWLLMAPSGSKWLQMAPNGSKFLWIAPEVKLRERAHIQYNVRPGLWNSNVADPSLLQIPTLYSRPQSTFSTAHLPVGASATGQGGRIQCKACFVKQLCCRLLNTTNNKAGLSLGQTVETPRVQPGKSVPRDSFSRLPGAFQQLFRREVLDH